MFFWNQTVCFVNHLRMFITDFNIKPNHMDGMRQNKFLFIFIIFLETVGSTPWDHLFNLISFTLHVHLLQKLLSFKYAWQMSAWLVLHHSNILFYFFKDFIYLFLERWEGREKEREKNINVWLPLTCPSLGDLARNPGMRPDWE